MKSSKSLNQTFTQDMIVRSIKIIDIGYITIIYFIIAFYLSIFIDKVILGEFDPEKYDKKHNIIILIELVTHMAFIGILTYIIRNLVEFIPFPLNNIYGFQHLMVKELRNAPVFFVIFMYNQYYFIKKMKYLYNRYKL